MIYPQTKKKPSPLLPTRDVPPNRCSPNYRGMNMAGYPRFLEMPMSVKFLYPFLGFSHSSLLIIPIFILQRVTLPDFHLLLIFLSLKCDDSLLLDFLYNTDIYSSFLNHRHRTDFAVLLGTPRIFYPELISLWSHRDNHVAAIR